MIAQLPNLAQILKRHDIHPKFHQAFRDLIERGVRPCKELRTRLDHVTNYKAALNEAMAELSKPLGIKFPSSTSTRFQSLDVKEFA